MFSSFKNIWAKGDVVARDKITNNILPQPTQMDALTDRYRVEIKDNITTNTIIDELSHYQNSKVDNRDLCEILEDAGFGYLIEEAEVLKELVSKLIIKNQHYRSAQKIITFLLSEVESIFNATIKPKLTEVSCESDLKVIFRTYLESKINIHLGENALEIFNRQINGMVFFLSGNSHLEWT
jgi:hypothetical protein